MEPKIISDALIGFINENDIIETKNNFITFYEDNT